MYKKTTDIPRLTPLKWIPSLYFAEGIPYQFVTILTVLLYRQLGLSNAEIALYTSWLYLPWVIKPFWSPFVDMLQTKRWWILTMQFLIGVSLAGVAFTLTQPFAIQASLALFWLLAFSSATHDIAADGFYILALNDPRQQSLFVGIRSMCYRLAMIAAQGLALAVVAALQTRTHRIAYSWSLMFMIASVLFLGLWLYHRFTLPKPIVDTRQKTTTQDIFQRFIQSFITFFQKPYIISALAFMIFYRFAEALLIKIAPLYLVENQSMGGLGLSLSDFSFATGTIGVIGLIAGGVLGSFVAGMHGLRRWYWPMILAITLPNIVYVYMSYATPESLWIVNACILIEQFGYGFGFVAYMLFLLYFSKGPHATAHYAICTGFMALSMMLPGLFAGYLQEALGYQLFFITIMACCVVTFIVAKYVHFDFNAIDKVPTSE